MKLGIGLGRNADPTKAATQAARQALRSVPKPKLALAFGGALLDQRRVYQGLRELLPADRLLGASSYAEITPAGVTKGSVAVLLMDPEGELNLRFAQTDDPPDQKATGLALARALGRPSGRAFGLLFAGAANGRENEMLAGLAEGLGPLPLFGGMGCGDYDAGMQDPAFTRAFHYSACAPQPGGARAALVELGKDTGAAFGFDYGWKMVAPPVLITRAEGGKVFEIEGKPVLDYYRQFLGRDAAGDFFRLMIQRFGFALQLEGAYAGRSIIKLPVACDLEAGSVTFYPFEDLQGRRVQLIQSSRQSLLEGARRAARECRRSLGERRPDLVLMVSCCTRSAILHSRMETELDAVREEFGASVPIFGAYSGGEFLPFLSRYEDVTDCANLMSGSFYHATTVGFAAFSFAKPPRAVAAPRRPAAKAADPEALRALLDASERTLDTSEAFLANLSRKSYEDGELLRKQNEVIHRYTPHEVWREVGEHVGRGVYELEDAVFNGAFLFMDVKGFTTFSEGHAPPDVVAALNKIFDPATRLIYECGGDVDKFIGDCIFAVFPRPRDAAQAGLKILELLAKAATEGSPFTVRIGINAGRAVRANVGSSSRREYTFIGDAVNLAQRLESNAAPGHLLMAEGVYEQARDLFGAVQRRQLSVKGRAAPVTAYEVGCSQAS